MNTINNVIYYEIGDWVFFIGTNHDLVTPTWQPGLILKIDEISPNGTTLTFKDERLFPTCRDGSKVFSNAADQFRPATQVEIDMTIKNLDPPIMLGKYEVIFGMESHATNTYCDEHGIKKTKYDRLEVANVIVTERQFRKIGKKAGWID